MKYRLLLLAGFLLFSLAISAQTFAVGHRSMTFTDPSRSNRSITTEIYYPANTAGNNVAVAAGQFPVLVFGHGFVMDYSAYSVVWNAVVPNGYIMVLPTTETSISPNHTDFAKDIAFCVGAMKAEGLNASSPFFGAVGSNSAVMGHSMGGGCAFLAVQYDPTITALATLAAAVTNPSSVNAATGVTIPALVIAGGNDCVAPPAQHQIPMYDSLASQCKSFVSITGGSHCQFAGYNFNCYFGEGTCTPQATINATTQQNITSGLLLNWLNFFLKNDCVAGSNFQNTLLAANGITSSQNCSLICTAIDELSSANQITVYPVPANDQIRITGNALDHSTISVFNVTGMLIENMNTVKGNSVELNTATLEPGIYFIRVRHTDNSISEVKFVITR